MKKFLALVLAFMMAMSLMVTVNAANVTFEDGEEITAEFQDDITVLAGMGVIKGQGNGEDGQLTPQRTITRAEMAAIVYRLHTGDVDDTRVDLYKGSADFVDVPETEWFAGYIGYCNSAQIIVGDGNGYFRPNSPVTGYEALTMLLRAMGYDQNKEFSSSASWQVEVAQIATTRGLLANTNKTTYSSKLSEQATREFVFEVAFQAANQATVQYTPALGYQIYNTNGIMSGSNENPSLGFKNFGLTYAEGIVLENQATNYVEWTTVGFERDDDDDLPDGVNYDITDNTKTQRLDVETGVDLFGHKVKVWFDDTGRGLSGTNEVAKTVYFFEDAATHTLLVKADDSVLSDGTNKLGDVVTNPKSGFYPAVVDAYYSESYGPIDDGRETNGVGGTASTSPVDLYMLISNSPNKALDVVISLNVQVSMVTDVNNWGTPKTVTVGLDNGTTDFEDDGEIDQDYLLGNSVTTLNEYEIGYAIGTLDDDDTGATGWTLDEIPSTITGAVTGFTHGSGDPNFGPDYVMVNGEKIEKSVLFDAVADDGADPYLPQQDDGSFSSGTYKFYLDSEGKYIGSVRVYSGDFLYGTYVDYRTDFGAGTFEYSLSGVTANGEIVTLPFSKYNNGSFVGKIADLGIYFHASSIAESINGSSYVGLLNDTNNSAKGLGYRGVLLGDAGNLQDSGNTNIGQLGWIQVGAADDSHTGYPDRTTIKSDWKTGAATKVSIDTRASQVGAVKAYTDSTDSVDIYFTNNTKFYLVDGYGTGNLKVTPVNGITALKGDSTSVDINFGSNDMWLDQFVYTTSNYWYASAGTYAKQIDTIFLPEKALSRNGAASSYFLSSETPVLINADNNAGKFTMYVNGVKGEYWIGGSDATLDGGNNNGVLDAGEFDFMDAANPATKLSGGSAVNKFFTLVPTNQKASDGQTIYQAVEIQSGNSLLAYGIINTTQATAVSYQAATRGATTALINGTLYNVANATVVNLFNGYDINNIGDLNDVSTIKGVSVYAVETYYGSGVVSAIYVTSIS